jgi:hypothetical protein
MFYKYFVLSENYSYPFHLEPRKPNLIIHTIVIQRKRPSVLQFLVSCSILIFCAYSSGAGCIKTLKYILTIRFVVK